MSGPNAPQIHADFPSPVQEVILSDDGVDLDDEPALTFVFDGFSPDAVDDEVQAYITGLTQAHPTIHFYLVHPTPPPSVEIGDLE